MLTAISLPVSKTATKTASAAGRLTYIDTIRTVLTVMVVMVHACVTYGSVGGWFYVEAGSDDLTKTLLSLFVTISQAFFMGLFFFISAYFTPGSIDRKGVGTFVKDRLLRLGLPLAVFSVILAKYPLYISAVRNHGFSGTLWQFATENFLRYLDAGPTWFLFALLVLGGAYGLYRLARRGSAPLGGGLAAPGIPALLGFALVMAVSILLTAQVSPIGDFKPLFGFIYLQPAFFPQYLLMFAAGILAYRNDWLKRIDGRQLRTWKWVAAGCAVALPVMFVAGGAAAGQFDAFITGFAWQSLALNLWVALTCVSFTMTLILWLRRRQEQHQPGATSKEISASAYAAYIIHPVLLVAITSNMSGLALYPLLKFAIAVPLAVSASFATGWLLRQIPGARAIL
jgi:glucan biosynthesis protein C